MTTFEKECKALNKSIMRIYILVVAMKSITILWFITVVCYAILVFMEL